MPGLGRHPFLREAPGGSRMSRPTVGGSGAQPRPVCTRVPPRGCEGRLHARLVPEGQSRSEWCEGVQSRQLERSCGLWPCGSCSSRLVIQRAFTGWTERASLSGYQREVQRLHVCMRISPWQAFILARDQLEGEGMRVLGLAVPPVLVVWAGVVCVPTGHAGCMCGREAWAALPLVRQPRATSILSHVRLVFLNFWLRTVETTRIMRRAGPREQRNFTSGIHRGLMQIDAHFLYPGLLCYCLGKGALTNLTKKHTVKRGNLPHSSSIALGNFPQKGHSS